MDLEGIVLIHEISKLEKNKTMWFHYKTIVDYKTKQNETKQNKNKFIYR